MDEVALDKVALVSKLFQVRSFHKKSGHSA